MVGFSDKLRLMNLLIDEIRTFKEFTIRGCREVNFRLIHIEVEDLSQAPPKVAPNKKLSYDCQLD